MRTLLLVCGWLSPVYVLTQNDFPGGSMVKNTPANAGDSGDMGLIPGSGRSPGGGMATHCNILAWKIPWTEEHAGLQSVGHRVEHD